MRERLDAIVAKAPSKRGKKSAADVRNYIATLFIDGNPKINPHQTRKLGVTVQEICYQLEVLA